MPLPWGLWRIGRQRQGFIGHLLLAGLYRSRQQRFERKADALLLRVDGKHLDFNLLPFAHHVAGSEHAAVPQLRNMDQAFDAGLQLYERAEIHESRYGAFYASADLVLRIDILPRVRADLAIR